MDTPLRPLLVAEMCHPEMFSVPLVGWLHADALFRHPGLRPHLVTQVRSRDALLRQGLKEGEDFTLIDTESISRLTDGVAAKLGGAGGKGWTTRTALRVLADRAFERRLWRLFKGRLKAGEFNLIHRITPLTPTSPCGFARKTRAAGPGGSRVPLVLGPLNGGLPWPEGYGHVRSAEREWLSHVRGAFKLLPGYRATRRHSDALVIGSRATWAQMPASCRDRCVYLPENAVDPRRLAEPVPVGTDPDAPLRLGFLGRLVPYKGCDVALEAAADLLRSGRASFSVIGDGPERPALEAQARELGVADRVGFHGWVPHVEAMALLAATELLVFPSLREFGGGVVPEAMASGVVPAVVDYGGPAELMTPGCGWRVPLGDRAALVAAFGAVIAEAEADRPALAAMAAAGREHVEAHLTWDRKAEQSLGVYRWVLGRGEKPDFAGVLGVELPVV